MAITLTNNNNNNNNSDDDDNKIIQIHKRYISFTCASPGRRFEWVSFRSGRADYAKSLCSYAAPVGGAEYCDQPFCLSVCLSVCLSEGVFLEPLDQFSRDFVYWSPVAVVRSSSDGVAIRYVLPVLWMTSHLAVMVRMGTSGGEIPGRSLMSMNALFMFVLHV